MLDEFDDKESRSEPKAQSVGGGQVIEDSKSRGNIKREVNYNAVSLNEEPVDVSAEVDDEADL